MKKKLASIIGIVALVLTLGIGAVYAQPQSPVQGAACCGGGWGPGGGGPGGGNGGWGCRW